MAVHSGDVISYDKETGQSSLIGGPQYDSISSMIDDNSSLEVNKVYNLLNSKLDQSSKDYLLQYYLNERSNKTAWDRQMEASNSQYQRTVADLRKAGINPFLALQSLQGSVPSSTGASVQGGLFTSRRNQQTQNTKDVAGRIMAVLGVIAAAVIGSML